MKAWYLAAAAMVIAGPAVAQAATPAEYVKMAGAGDLYEKQSSQLVLATTHDAKVRRFANEMIADHSKSTAKVKAAAARAGLKPRPPMLMPDQAQMIAQLRAAKGPERDRLYLEQQATAHQKALTLHSDYARTGRSAPLKAAAAQIAPVVQHHIEMLKTA